eukprot:TRINITY_DN1366_c0_g1_i1.p1 TRINITY_DN1366_c0_g1~~TRINITY_DN1366_c0_g1_i1.p1  ORF type:complete len:614 (-),score=116.59 TRINITY_DN1366_c0_g1_i1:689-2530(-)
MRLSDRYNNIVNRASESFNRLEFPSEPAVRVATAVAIGVGVTAFAGAAFAAAVGGFLIYHERGSIRRAFEGQVPRPKPLTPDQWHRAFQQGRLKGGGEKVIGRVRKGGCDPNVRAEVWPFLLGLYEANSTSDERAAQREERRGKYEGLRRKARILGVKAAEEEARRTKVQRQKDEVARVAFLEAQARREAAEAAPERDANASTQVGDDSTLSRDENVEEQQPLLQQGKGDEHLTPADSGNDARSNSSCSSGSSSRGSLEKENELGGGRQKDNGGRQEAPATSKGEEQSLGVSGSVRESEESERVAGEDEREEGMAGDEGTKRDGNDEMGSSGRSEDADFLADFASWRRIMRLDAVRMNAAWIPGSSQAPTPADEAEALAKDVGLIEDAHLEPSRRHHAARLVAILEAYALHDMEIGYCQGMSDLLSPFVALIDDDSDAFWCFESFMRKARQNFRVDEIGIKRQLDGVSKILRRCDPELFEHLQKANCEDCIFCYRMVVVLLRRELSFEQTLGLWEVIWADAAAAAASDVIAASAAAAGGSLVRTRSSARWGASDDLLLFIIAAIIRQNRKELLSAAGVDEVLRLCNSFSGRLDVWKLVDSARDLVAVYNSSVR